MLFNAACSLCLLLFLVARETEAQEDMSKNLFKRGVADIENLSEGPVPQEAFNMWWAPVAPELMLENTYFNVVTDKAHGGTKSIRIALTPESSQKWLLNPGKTGYESLWLHYSI